jgi:enoyl-CoA hydratase/carnithine racemase
MPLIKTKLLARTKNGEFIGVITLNKEQSLNALNLEMVELMSACLVQWRNDDSVVAVLIDGAGHKAFCAGGDVVSMYQSMKLLRTEQHVEGNVKLVHPPEFLSDFFSQEYSLDYCINTYPKPIITWGSGIVMGGGLGLFAASKFAIATDTSRFAMPEISIGLFPDVGGSYFLNKMPAGVGLFLALTGSSFNGIDAYDINLASHKLSSDSKQALQARLIHMDAVSEQGIDEVLSALQLVDKPLFSSVEAKLKPNFNKLNALSDAQTLSAAVLQLTAIVSEKNDDRWWLKSIKTLNNGSPITANIVFEQLKRSKDFTLADCFRQELSIALTCSLYGEFEEGVRALLIDKDFAPQWLYQNRDDVPSSLIATHFTYFADATNPLHHLEQTYGG